MVNIVLIRLVMFFFCTEMYSKQTTEPRTITSLVKIIYTQILFHLIRNKLNYLISAHCFRTHKRKHTFICIIYEYMPRHLHSFEVARHHIHIPCPHEHSIRVRRAQARNQSLRVSTGSALHAIPSPLTACQFGKLFFFLRARLRLLCDQLRART